MHPVFGFNFFRFRLVEVEVRADFFKKRPNFRKIGRKCRFFGQICHFYEIFERFEPESARRLDFFDFFTQNRRFGEKCDFSGGVVLPRDGTLQKYIQQAFDLHFDVCQTVAGALRRCRGAVGALASPNFDLRQHQLGPLVGNSDLFQNFPLHQPRKKFFTDVSRKAAGTEFLRATVVMQPLLTLCRHARAALVAAE
ncbi:MAG: hypothetical protein ACOX3F_10175 [Kiritimatiellia bacterium]